MYHFSWYVAPDFVSTVCSTEPGALPERSMDSLPEAAWKYPVLVRSTLLPPIAQCGTAVLPASYSQRGLQPAGSSNPPFRTRLVTSGCFTTLAPADAEAVPI